MKNVAKVLSFVVIAGIGMSVVGCDKPVETKKTTPPPAPTPAPEKK